MSSPSGERRRYQRITFPRPVAAKYGSDKAFLVDISVSGARIAHQGELSPGSRNKINFDWEGSEISFECEVIRCAMDKKATDSSGKPIYQSGVHFVRAIGQSAAYLRGMIAQFVMRALDEQKANARGIPPRAATFQSGIKEVAYVTYRYVRNEWQKAESKSPQQPLDGFTVSAKEDPMQVDMLCKTYESSDFAGRKMIRQLAEMSITDTVPTRRYSP
jgi:hypothetical protein